jgi:hypothetical protein
LALAGPTLAEGGLMPEQHNLAYCAIVLTHAEFGGERNGENDPASAAILMARLAKRLNKSEAEIAADVLPAIETEVRADMAARQRPRFSAIACAGYAFYIKTE